MLNYRQTPCCSRPMSAPYMGIFLSRLCDGADDSSRRKPIDNDIISNIWKSVRESADVFNAVVVFMKMPSGSFFHCFSKQSDFPPIKGCHA